MNRGTFGSGSLNGWRHRVDHAWTIWVWIGLIRLRRHDDLRCTTVLFDQAHPGSFWAREVEMEVVLA